MHLASMARVQPIGTQPNRTCLIRDRTSLSPDAINDAGRLYQARSKPQLPEHVPATGPTCACIASTGVRRFRGDSAPFCLGLYFARSFCRFGFVAFTAFEIVICLAGYVSDSENQYAGLSDGSIGACLSGYTDRSIAASVRMRDPHTSCPAPAAGRPSSARGACVDARHRIVAPARPFLQQTTAACAFAHAAVAAVINRVWSRCP